MAAFVILDRDGVINEDSPAYIKSVDEWQPVPGSLEAISLLTDCGIEVFIATNQAGVARGKLTLTSLLDIHTHMLKAIDQAGGAIKDLVFCPHHPDENCDCRKPKPGMLLQLANRHGLDLEQGYYVGDSQKDLDAAVAAGCRGVLVLSGNGKKTSSANPDFDLVYDDLLSFARVLTSNQ